MSKRKSKSSGSEWASFSSSAGAGVTKAKLENSSSFMFPQSGRGVRFITVDLAHAIDSTPLPAGDFPISFEYINGHMHAYAWLGDDGTEQHELELKLQEVSDGNPIYGIEVTRRQE